MRLFARVPMRYLVGALLALIGVMAITLLLVAWAGLYSVAASRGHWAIVEWFLTFGMRNSVETHAFAIDTPPLDDPDLYRLGAGHFHSGCAYCHGAPGIPINPIALSMLPPPPDLSDATRQWKDRELFWIVKNGIKYTGMPAWASQRRDDEVWTVVAFLKRLPALDAEAYRDLAMGGLQVLPQSGRELAVKEASSEAASACARCHGADDRRPASGLVPVLHGQPAEFLIAALDAFASGKRESGIMQPIASDLTREAAHRIAEYYSRLRTPARSGPAPAMQFSAIERGRILAVDGDPDAKIPPCTPCHGAQALETYPRLAGQNGAYLVGRLRRWQSGILAATETEAIMAPIARLLSERQIEDVAAYFASLSGTASAAERP